MDGFDALRDYPRGSYNDITTKRAKPEEIDVVVAHFELEDEDKNAIEKEFQSATYVFGRRLDNSSWQRLVGVPEKGTTEELNKDLLRFSPPMWIVGKKTEKFCPAKI